MHGQAALDGRPDGRGGESDPLAGNPSPARAARFFRCNAADATVIGPDVIVGNLYQVASYGSSGGISAFAVGTVSRNVGDAWLNWFSSTNQHPVIGQSMYRLKNDRFEHIGQSWLKHGFYALSEGLCFSTVKRRMGRIWACIAPTPIRRA